MPLRSISIAPYFLFFLQFGFTLRLRNVPLMLVKESGDAARAYLRRLGLSLAEPVKAIRRGAISYQS